MCEIKNKILIIGTDDHNTLAVVRDLGKHDCNISVLIHGDFTSIHDVKISKSRYGKNKTDYVNDSIEKIYEWIKRNAKQKSNLKTILFPCSDLAAYTVDYYGKELGNCIIPGFKGQPGRVVELMDKINQKKFADCYGIPMAKTWCYKITNANKIVIPYPCILKPEISAKGRKGDIRICRNSVEFESAVKMLEANGYEEVVLQEFLVKQYEVCALGCIIDEMPQRYIGGYIKKLREWPIGGGGNMSCSRFIQTPELDEIIHKVTRVLYEQGYYIDSGRNDAACIAKDLARKNNLDVVYSKRLDSESERNHYGINRFSDGPLDFIKEIECADYVVVSSFHGVAFSILMEKNFIALLHENTGSRVHSLLRKLGLQDRIVKNFEDYQNRKFAAIDYTRVRPIIENWKMESIEHLRKICEL